MQQNVILKSMMEAALKAGSMLQKMYKDNSAVSVNKGGSYYDVVSKADFQSEDIILKMFAEALPGVNILSEEKGLINQNSSDTIIIDPLDGSSNFLLGIPHFSISMAYVRNGEILASVIYNPITENMYVAQKGKGVLLNKKKMKVVSKKELQSISVNFSHKAVWKEKRRFFDSAYAGGVSRVMNNWSPNLDFCLLAENKINAVVSMESLIFDFAPGVLVARESGCFESPKTEKVKIGINVTRSFVVADKKTLATELSKLI